MFLPLGVVGLRLRASLRDARTSSVVLSELLGQTGVVPV